MPVTSYNQLKPGLVVSIVLKADQPTGKQVRGVIGQLLTRHNHPRGIKVKLTDGRVGRVQQILPPAQIRKQSTMDPNNPWADSESQGRPYNNSGNQHQQQAPRQPEFADSQHNQHQDHGYEAPRGPPPSQRMGYSDTEQALVQEEDRAAQVEHMQQYEAAALQSQDDINQAELQRQFPKIDSSLIAAIYNERKSDMGEVKELLQELDTS